MVNVRMIVIVDHIVESYDFPRSTYTDRPLLKAALQKLRHVIGAGKNLKNLKDIFRLLSFLGFQAFKSFLGLKVLM